MTTDNQCAQSAEQALLSNKWMVVQVQAGQPRPQRLTHNTALLVATAVPHAPRIALQALEHKPEDAGHLVVHQRGVPAWLWEHLTTLQSWAITTAGPEVRFHAQLVVHRDSTMALGVDQLIPANPDVRWHSRPLNSGWLHRTRYYGIPDAWGHTSFDASGGGPCRHTPGLSFAAHLTRTWAVTMPSTVHDREGWGPPYP